MTHRSTEAPDIIGVGFRRCGSSMLHEAMNQHPQIDKPARGLHYFSEHYDRGAEWYAQQLCPRRPGGVALEFSVSYGYPEHSRFTAARISEAAPDSRLLAVVRNPIERAFSDYLRSIRLCEIPSAVSFEEALELHPELLSRGCYHRLLTPFLDRFPAERVGILFLEDLVSDTDSFWARLWRFIGVQHDYRPQTTNTSSGLRSVRIAALNKAIFAIKSRCDGMAQRCGATGAWTRLKQNWLTPYRSLLAWNTSQTAMKPETRSRLADYYADDISSLQRATGRGLEHWTTQTEAA